MYKLHLIFFISFLISCEKKIIIKEDLIEHGYKEINCEDINQSDFILADCKNNECYFVYYKNSKPFCAMDEKNKKYFIKDNIWKILNT